MFFLLLLLFILIIFMLFQNRKGKRNYPVILIFPYFVALCGIILYISKDTYYYNLIKEYFYLPNFFWRWLFFVEIDKMNIIRLVNLSSLSILLISVYFSFFFYSKTSIHTQRVSKIILWIYCLIQAIIYDPAINLAAYYKLYPDYLSVQQYAGLEYLIYDVTHSVNILIVIFCLLCLIVAAVKSPKLNLFRFHYVFLSISYATLTFVYIFFISAFPNFYLKISKISDTYTFRSIPLGSNAVIYNAFPYVLIFGASIITYCAYTLTKLFDQANLQELKISKQISSSETTSKIFCHYIKNEILAISSEVDLIPEGEDTKEVLDDLKKRCDTLYSRIDEIHRSTKTSELSLKPCSMQELLNNTLGEFPLRSKDIQVICDFPKQEVDAMVDAVYMGQAIHNIIKNSLDAMEGKPGGNKQLIVRLQVTNLWIQLEITDNGKGIFKENISSIFLPFYSSHPYSTHWGVGLTLTYKIISAHEGKIDVKSTPGAGTTVRILLPGLTPHISPYERNSIYGR